MVLAGACRLIQDADLSLPMTLLSPVVLELFRRHTSELINGPVIPAVLNK